MGDNESLPCPVDGCSFDGSISRVIHHITSQSDSAHTWEALGFRHSWHFRQAHTVEDDVLTKGAPPNASETGSIDPGEVDVISLESVPGIGDSRAEKLRAAGYHYARDVANASISELGQIPTVSEDSARCIRVTAREECGDQDPFISKTAYELDVERGKVVDAYAKLAPGVVTPEEAVDTLSELFNPTTERSVIHLTDHSLLYRHFLLQAGFRQFTDVAYASIDELTDAPYIGNSRALSLKESVQERLS